MLESAYYSSEDTNIPSHIHDIFQNGLPADFRLIGATTRQPQEIPAAIRSRCVEIYFRGLTPDEIGVIGEKAAKKIGLPIQEKALDELKKYAANGREAVNIIQIAAGIVSNNNNSSYNNNCNNNCNKDMPSKEITPADIEWVVQSGHYTPRPEKKIPAEPQIGLVNGLAVYGPSMGMLLEIEVTVLPVKKGSGQIIITGIVEEEEMRSLGGNTVRRKSMAKGSVENVLTV
jgi:Lon-like ATP-dependent protease